MSDEIEIEEHDLLDDPTVRNIFPDINRLKQEILDYEYNEAPESEDPEPTSITSDSHFNNTENNISISVNKSVTSAISTRDAQHNFQNNEHNGFIRGDKSVEVQVRNNKIILGSKPVLPLETKSEYFEKHVKPYCAAVVLEDFGLYLNSSNRYCNHCRILFPTNTDYNFHKQNIHLELLKDAKNYLEKGSVENKFSSLEISKQQNNQIIAAVDCKDEYKVVEQKTEKMLVRIDSNNVNICLICKRRFSRKSNLKLHMFHVHNISKKKLDEIIKNKKPGPRVIEQRNECFHCKKSFRTQNLLIEHIYSILQTPSNTSNNYANKIVVGKKRNNDLLMNKANKTEKQNRTLKEVLNENKIKITNKNKNTVDREAFKDTPNVIKCFRCNFCLLYFNTIKYFSRHMAIKHKTVKKYQITKVAFDPKCKHCLKKFENIKKYNSHLLKVHPKIILEAIRKSRKAIVSENEGLSKVSEPVAHNMTDNEYYRCSDCLLYFKKITLYTRHMASKHDVANIANANKVPFDPKCKYCPRVSINLKRYNCHLYRTHSEKFGFTVKGSKKTLATTEKRDSSVVSHDNNDIDIDCHKCNYCHLYFKTTIFYVRHMTNKHNMVKLSKKRVEFNPKCKFCPKVLNTVILMNNHIQKCHSVNLKDITFITRKATDNANKLGKSIILGDQNGMDCYKCRLCPVYFKTMKYYGLHMKIRHKTVKIPKALKVKFDQKCKYCPLIFKRIQFYNKHIYNRHYAELNEVMEKAKSTCLISTSNRNKTLHSNLKKVASSKEKFFRCCYCSHYFKTLTYYNNHVKKKHKVQGVREAKKIEFDPKCKYCLAVASDDKTYNRHLYKCHLNRLQEIFKESSKNKVNAKSTNLDTEQNKPKLKVSRSGAKSITIVNNAHRDISLGVNVVPISKSTLFKCHKCDIHFLTIKSALDHSNHMELLINWKCTLCQRIFKDKDRWLHEKQHVFSHVFTVYDINQSEISQILYKCSKCVMHFDESVIDSHHRDCAVKIPQSYMCKICDILVDCKAQICHEYNHKHRHFTSSDFIIIETTVVLEENANKHKLVKNSAKANILYDMDMDIDIIDNNQDEESKKYKNDLKRKIKNDENVTKSKRLKKDNNAEGSTNKLKNKTLNVNYSSEVTAKQLKFDKISLKLSFCKSCNCFVSMIGHKRKTHAEGKCANLKSQICKLCGLRLSHKTMSTHRQIHTRIKNLQLQHFKFYDFKSGKRVQPPMPEYEKCGICDVNFISKATLSQHVCSDKQYKVCDICNIKIFKQVFHLHMAFHKYRTNETLSVAPSNNIVTSNKKAEINKRSENNLLILYCCKVCYVYVDTYDRLIEHCQKHCLNNISTDTEECKICRLKFEDGCLKSHSKIHEKRGVPSFEKLFVDPFYFRFDNKVWLNHVFGSHPIFSSHHKIEMVLLNSAYRFEHRFKMEIVQEGSPDLTLHKCVKCNRHVEADVIYQHIENSCSNLRKYPCPVCNLDFISSFSLKRHKTIHKDPTAKVFRIIHFNRQKDSDLNKVIFSPPKLYVLYQCRRCNGVVDGTLRMSHECNKSILKSCADCGLLLSEDVSELHISMHKTLDSFISENMKVILFGQYTLHDDKYIPMTSSFRGKINDYSFFKCSKCQVCVKNKTSTLNHTCCSITFRVACSVCGLYFRSDKLMAHIKSHDTDPDLVLDNMILIEFHPSTSKLKEDTIQEELQINKFKEVTIQDELQFNNETDLTNIQDEIDSNKETVLTNIQVEIDSNKETVSTNIQDEIYSIKETVSLNIPVEIDSNKETDSTNIQDEIDSSKDTVSTNIQDEVDYSKDTVSTNIHDEIDSNKKTASSNIPVEINSYKQTVLTNIQYVIDSNKDTISTKNPVEIDSNKETDSTNIQDELDSSKNTVSTNIQDEIDSSKDTVSTNISVEIDSKNVPNNNNTKDSTSSVFEHNEPSVDKKTKEISDTEKTVDIYHCSCGLHFLDENSITEHLSQCGSKSKQAKQNCSKCGLLFTPNVLFKHLLTHHGNKNHNYTINIVEKFNNIIFLQK